MAFTQISAPSQFKRLNTVWYWYFVSRKPFRCVYFALRHYFCCPIDWWCPGITRIQSISGHCVDLPLLESSGHRAKAFKHSNMLDIHRLFPTYTLGLFLRYSYIYSIVPIPGNKPGHFWPQSHTTPNQCGWYSWKRMVCATSHIKNLTSITKNSELHAWVIIIAWSIRLKSVFLYSTVAINILFQ